ncbi:MAG: hypothetical protein ABI083_20445 [Lapillicoccus sp.]
MAIFSKGADPDALDRSADRIQAYSAECASIRSATGTSVAALQGQWSGGDLEALIRRWPAVAQQLDLAGTTLSGLEQKLRSNATAQRVTSAGAAGSGASGGSGPGSAGGGPTIGQTTPKPEKHWWESVLDTAGDAGAWTYNHTVVPAVDGLANVGQAMVEHPEDVLGLVTGAGMIVLGGAGEVGGGLLDVTGVGAVVGVPVNIASAGLIAAGAGVMAMSGGDLAHNASQNDNHVLDEAQGPSASQPKPGDPLPEANRPDTAGSDWKGRVADNGKGEVWQRPDGVDAPKGSPKDANEVRIMDGNATYPDGYVRFYNEYGQPIRLDGKPGGSSDPLTHIPVRPDGTYDIPQGWNP